MDDIALSRKLRKDSSELLSGPTQENNNTTGNLQGERIRKSCDDINEPNQVSAPSTSEKKVQEECDITRTPAVVERTLDATEQFITQLHLEALADEQNYRRVECSEIRLAGDPQLARLLDQIVDRCRTSQVALTLLRLRAISSNEESLPKVNGSTVVEWQVSAYKLFKSKCTGTVALAYLSSDGELSLVCEDLDRTHATRLARETVLVQEYTIATSARTSVRCGLSCGSATVSSPTRGFSFEQLASAAERCLQGAALQGRGAIKSLEVF